MIIVLPAIKDTYVTNLETQNIDAISSNVGHAATLDLFKLYNENKNAKSSAVLKFLDITAQNNEEFTLIDALGNSVTFIIDMTRNIQDASVVENDKVVIGLLNAANIEDYVDAFKNSINKVTENSAGFSLNITAFSNSNNELLLKQDNSGASGDTLISLPVQNYVSVSSNSSNYFARKETSAILLKFDIDSFKNTFMSNIDFNLSAFNSLKAEIVLHDVTAGQTKPKNYNINAYNLLKEFEEGVGKDTIHFSDIGITSNFTNLNNNELNNSFKIPGYVSLIDDVSVLDHPDAQGDTSNPTFFVDKGNEDVILDITEYFKEQISNVIDNKGILITFSDDILNNEKTYFVKRFGSRHLINKSLVPMLKISIPDASFTIPKKTQFAKRYLDNSESFYLFNRGTSLNEFNSPANSSLKFKIISEDKNIVYLDNIDTNTVKNYKGQTVPGIKKVNINKTDMSRFNSTISENIKNNKLICFIRWYWEDNNSDTFIVKEEKVIFNLTETTSDKTYSNLISSVKFENTTLNGDNTVNIGHVYFLDTRASLEVVKVPFDILSENLGEVKYQLVNVDNNRILYDYSDSTKLFYDGEKYVFNFCIPEIFKNMRVKLNFKVTNQISDSIYIINNKEVFKVE